MRSSMSKPQHALCKRAQPNLPLGMYRHVEASKWVEGVSPVSWEVGEWEEGSFRKEMEAKWNHECGPLFIL